MLLRALKALACIFLSASALCVAGQTRAAEPPLSEDLNESVVRLPVNLSVRDGGTVSGDMLLTIFKPSGSGPFPIAILSHGRKLDRSTPARVRLSGMASYLVRHGFAVFVPTRLGYGSSVTTKPARNQDPEDSGDCRDKDYLGALQPAVQQIVLTLNYARQQAYTDADRHLVVGHSMGGISSAAYAATNPPGLIGYVNFAGGVGGDPAMHPGVPCQPERLTQTYARYGKTTRVPSLWIYAENDRFFAPAYSSAWHRAFAAGGTSSRFVLHPPFGADGHQLFSDGLKLWRPILDGFLADLGMRNPPLPEMPLASGHANIQDTMSLPWSNSGARTRGYMQFLASAQPRAFAISESGNWGWASGPEEPASMALAYCNRNSPKPCVLYAVDEVVVWRGPQPSAESPTVSAQRPAQQR